MSDSSGDTKPEYGCVMLTAELQGISPIPKDWAYKRTAHDPAYVGGIPDVLHVTLKFGLIPSLVTADDVFAALEDWEPPTVAVPELVRHFGPENSLYICFGLPIPFAGGPGVALREAHALLSKLPHVDTYPHYTPHVTLGYVRPEYAEYVQRLVIPDLQGRRGAIEFGHVMVSGFEIPTAAGFYLDRNGDPWRLTVGEMHKYWHVVDSNLRWLEEKPIESYAPFTRLVPAKEAPDDPAE